MNEQEIHAIVKKQRAYFYTGATLNVCLLYTSDAADE